MSKDKTLTVTKSGNTYQDENNAETIKIILPKVINSIDLKVRWWIYKAKLIKLKLGVVSVVEQLLKEVTKYGDDIQKKFIAELAKLIHDDNKAGKE